MTTMIPQRNRPKAHDSVIAEVRRVKIELLERHNFDLSSMARDARERQGKSGHRIVTRQVWD